MGEERRHETRDMDIRPIVMFGAGLVGSTAAVLLLMAWLFGYLAAREAKLDIPPSPLAETRRPPPEPRLQITPATDLEEMRRTEDAVLNSYGWVDRGAGIVRVPIDRAITLLAQRGLPVRPQPKGQK